MNLRKLLHLPSPKQSLAILDDIKLIQKRCSEIGETERKEQKENQRSHDGRCPKCRATQDKIVDRMAAVEGVTNFRGHLFKIVGRLAIETKPVNHCNVCGHEWEKFKTKTITDMAIIKVTLDYLSNIIRNPERNKRYSWKHEAIEVFKDCSAEAIFAIQKEYKPSLRYPLTKKQLKTKYKSVFDKNNNHEKSK